MRPEPILALIFIVLPLACVWIAKAHWTHERYMRALQLRAEANARLFDRFGSDPTFLEFLKTEGHSGIFDVSVVDPNRSWPIMRMLAAIQIGLILVCAGFGFFWIHNNQWVDGNAPAVLGVLAFALGSGSLLSAVAAFIVGRLWGHLFGTTSGPARPVEGR